MINISRAQIFAILAVCLLGIVFAAPNVLDRKTAEDLPSYVPSQQFSLGLDLQGGAHLLFKVEMAGVFKTNLQDLVKTLRTNLRDKDTRVRYLNLRATSNGAGFKLVETSQADTARRAIRNAIRDLDGAQNALTGQGPAYEFDIADDGQVSITLTDEGRRKITERTVEQVIQVIRKRVDETGVREPVIQKQGEDRVLVQVPGISDPQRIKDLIGKTAKMTFHLVNDTSTVTPGSPAPRGSRWVHYEKREGQQTRPPELIYDEVALDGKHLVDANQSFDRGLPVVTFRFDATGSRIFCRITQNNVNKRFATVLDDIVITAPVIRSPICGGTGQIEGGFTVQSAKDLSLLLRAGALPTSLTVLEERTVGPGLGQDSIDAGKFASVLGLILVVVFMVVAYGRFGLMANVALLMNLVLIAAILSFLQATLTLPGIAGIVLTIGMAVDANVLVFERIREEVRAGRTPMSAVDTGYSRALTTIIDSNLTTFIAALLLYLFGSGPVKGFGVTLAVGLATSMFTAIMVTRLMVVTWLVRKKPATLPL